MFRICKIVAETAEQEKSLKQFLKGYPVEITQEFGIKRDGMVGGGFVSVPTLLIGWNSTKHSYPEQKISDNEVMKNVFWTYNESECKEIDGESFHKNIEDFVNENLKKWLPSDFRVYDPILNGDFYKFIESNIIKDEITYIHFNKGAIYLRNGDSNLIINVKSLWLVEDNFKDKLTKFFNELDCIVYSYDGIESYVNIDQIKELKALDIIRWVKFSVDTPKSYFQIIPGVDVSKYIPFLMSKIPVDTFDMDGDEYGYFKRMCERDKVARWMSTRYISFSYEFDKKLDFLYRDYSKLSKINYSTKRTLTGRITPSGKYNPQNLAKEGPPRAMIVPRYRGGQIYQFDYTSFETRIALYLCEDQQFIEDYYDKDLHAETAIIMFDTLDFTKEQREIAKLINHSVIYGAGESTILKKMGNLPDAADKMIKVKEFLHPLFEKSKQLTDIVESKGYFINKWGSIIRPDKSYAAFNNYIQSTASEIIVDKVTGAKELLKGNRSQFMFQVHDSLVFDIHPEEVHLIDSIAKMMSYNNGMILSVNYKSGQNYRDLSSESVYF